MWIRAEIRTLPHRAGPAAVTFPDYDTAGAECAGCPTFKPVRSRCRCASLCAVSINRSVAGAERAGVAAFAVGRGFERRVERTQHGVRSQPAPMWMIRVAASSKSPSSRPNIGSASHPSGGSTTNNHDSPPQSLSNRTSG